MSTSFQRLWPLPPLLALCVVPLLANVPALKLAASETNGGAGLTLEQPAAFSAPAEAGFPPFSRYELILERQPFGRVAVAPPMAVAAPVDLTAQQNLAEQQKLARQINMSGVTINPNGATFIGFTDLSVKPPANYYLAVGAAGGGWLVLAADYHAETATIERDGIQINLKLGQGLVGGGVPPPAASMFASAASRGAGAPAVPPPAATNREPAFRTITEQLVSMVASVPMGSTLPPLPVIDGDDLGADSRRALATPIVIGVDDTPGTATHKENVALIKEDMRQTLDAEGGTAGSYLKRLQERHREAEQKRKQEAEKLRHMVETVAKEKVLAELAAINASLEAEGISTIAQGEVMMVEEAEE